jgi:ssDNA-binding Zn-finger/Zn-ribbon topoisomerase 1
MKTSTVSNGRCPKCGDEVTEDKAGKGFVRHKTNPNCDFQRRQKDSHELGRTNIIN